ncbi:nucleotidyltransferase family protein [bacterium]|nr:nucleotidyltransferase family protein [bacterium]
MSHSPSRMIAVIPAAGLSRRMGQPKLLMPIGSSSVIERLLNVLLQAKVESVIVVCRADDLALQRAATACGAIVVTAAVDPPDMRTSVQHGLDYAAEHFPMADDDGWLLIPADHPVLTGPTVSLLIEIFSSQNPDVLVPTHNEGRGHPTIFSWRLAKQVRQLPADKGLNVLARDEANRIVEFEVDDPTVLLDLDTPEDYDRILKVWGAESSLRPPGGD